MLRKVLPYILIVLLVLTDVSVVPVFTASVYALPLTLLFVMCAGMLLGPLHGVLCGLLGGLLVDILTGYPLGYMMLSYVACGLMSGFAGFDTDERRAQEGYSRLRAFIRRAVAVAAALALFELVTIVYQYFHTALMQSRYFVLALVRVAIGAAAVSALYYLLTPVLVGRTDARVQTGGKREVKDL